MLFSGYTESPSYVTLDKCQNQLRKGVLAVKINRRQLLNRVLFIFLVVLTAGAFATVLLRTPANESSFPAKPAGRETSNQSQTAARQAAEASAKEELNLPAHALRVNPKTYGFPAQGIPVLMYHAIESLPGNSLGVPPEQFAEEMKYLQEQGYQTLSVERFAALINNPQGTLLPPRPILLTFDDGYADNYRTAWPILQQYGFVGTFFIVSASVGPGMMTWDNLRDLAQHGNSIGSHSVHHYDLTKLSAIQLQHELVDSKAALTQELHVPVLAFCYPSGRYTAATEEMLARTGYSLAFSTEPGRVSKSANPFALKRIRIPGGLPLTAFKNLLNP